MSRAPHSPLITWLEFHPWAKTWLYLPAVGWAGLIFWFSSRSDLPALAESWQDFLLKKTAHFLIYAGLYFWLWWGTYLRHNLQKTQWKPLTSLQVLQLLVLVGLYAASDEFHQSFTASRHPSPGDVIIDLAGASTIAIALQNWSTMVLGR